MNKYLLSVVFSILFVNVSAQQTHKISLIDVVEMAHTQSVDALQAKTQFYNSHWQYKIFRTDFLPKLNLEASSALNRSISPITLPNGQDAFVSRNQVTSTGTLSLAQNIAATGTQLFVNSGLNRIDIISTPNSKSFLATPLIIGFNQPVLSYSELKWSSKIEPLKYTEAKRQYLESMENVSIRALNIFFDLYLAQLNLDIALKNQANNDTLVKMARGRYNLGKIAENELLQIELSQLNSNTAVNQANLDVQVATFNLKKFLRLKNDMKIELYVPMAPPAMRVDYDIALAQARKNRKKPVELERQLLEADRDLAKAKGEAHFKANLYGTYGLTRSAPDISTAYIKPIDQQQVTFGMQMPIIGWGRARAQVNMAKASKELVETIVEQENINFEQEVFLSTMRYDIQLQQFLSAAKADTIGIKRYEVAKQRYYIGKIDITALNIAAQERDLARRSYVEALKNYWNTYYTIRRLTLFDFQTNNVLKSDIKD